MVLPALLALAALPRALNAAVSLKERPVMKVVRLLKDMGTELRRDLDDDKAVHEQLGCWCKKNDQEKTAAIELGESRESELEAFLDETAAKMREAKAKREATQEEVDRDWDALNKASALRMKENKVFHEEEAHLQEAIQAADQAIVVLGQHHPQLAQLRAAAGRLREARVLSLDSSSISGLRAVELKAFLAEPQSSFLAIPGYRGYVPQSGQIFGILKQLKADFESHLSEAQATEAKALADFKALEAAKQEEIRTGKQLVVQLDQALAEMGERTAQAFKELDATKRQLGLDREFLKNLKKKCSESAAEFEARTKDRLEEIAAVDDTIRILNTDKAFDVFDKSVNLALLQTSGSSRKEQSIRARAAAALRAAPASPGIALLTAQLRLDAFTKVKAEIDKMVEQLQRQQQDEVEHRDWCIKELAENSRSQAAGYDKKANLETKIADLKQAIKSLTESIAAAKEEIASMQEEMKRASETRESENAGYQQTIVDQRLTQMILRKAMARMQQVYGFLQEKPQPGAAHTALSSNHTDPGNGPARFTKYERHASGSRVVAAIDTIIADARKSEDASIQAEEDAQTAYEDFMKESNGLIAAGMQKIADMTESKATSEQSLSMATTDLKQTATMLEGLHGAEADLHQSCDYLVKNFEARQSARAAEVAALRDAKAILSGMK